jgi:hypothetical protein
LSKGHRIAEGGKQEAEREAGAGAGGRKQKAEGRKQKAESRRQKAESRRQKAEDEAKAGEEAEGRRGSRTAALPPSVR